MSVQKEKSNGPMLYINQPSFGQTPNKMQHVFKVDPKEDAHEKPQATETPENQKTAESKNEKSNRKRGAAESMKKQDAKTEQEQKASNNAGSKKEKGNAHKDSVAFKEMSIQERIEYLLNMPFGIPPIKCEIVTDKRSYRGIVASKKENEIMVLHFGSPRNLNIPIEEIKDLKMKSFN